MLTHRVPFPPNRGDRIRSWQVLQYLSARGDVYLATTADEPVTADAVATLNQHCREVIIADVGRVGRWVRTLSALARGRSLSEGMFSHPHLATALETWQRQHRFAAAIVYCSSMFPYVDNAKWDTTPRWVDLIDVDSQKWSDYADASQSWKHWVYRREAKCVQSLEQRIVNVSNRVSLTTDIEAGLLADRCSNAQPIVMNNGVDPQFLAGSTAPAIQGRLAFVGMLDYLPNVTGIGWFVNSVWPRIRATVPHATLEIVGRRPTPDVQRLAKVPGVQVSANVPSVIPHLAAAELVISPLQIARGVQNKVLEAMAMQRAVIATPAVCRGLNATPGEQLWSATEADEWSAAVVNLLQNDRQREQLAQAGCNYVREHHIWQQCLAPLGRWLDTVTTQDLAHVKDCSSIYHEMVSGL